MVSAVLSGHFGGLGPVQCRLVSPSSSALSSCYLGCNRLSSIADIKWVLWWSVSTGYSIQGRWPVSTSQYTGCGGQLSGSRVPGQQWQCRAVGGWSQCRQHVMVSTVTSLNTEQPQVTGAIQQSSIIDEHEYIYRILTVLIFLQMIHKFKQMNMEAM